MGRNTNVTDTQFLEILKNHPNLNDRQIAKLLNCDKNVIYRKRLRLNIKNPRNKDISNEDFLILYKQGLSDTAIGKILKASECFIGALRKKLKLASNFEPLSKNPEFREKFISLVDTERSIEKVANLLGIEKSTANGIARRLKLKSNFQKLVEKNKEIRKDIPPYIKPSTIIKELTSEEEEILIGTLLGDACLFLPANPSFEDAPEGSIRHSLKQKEYCLWKYNKLIRLCGVNYEYELLSKQTGKIYKGICMLIRRHHILKPIYDMFYCGKNNKKRITEEIMNKLTPLGLAVWFMDDGSKSGKSYKLCTNGFTEEDVRKAIVVLKNRFNLNCTINFDKKKPLIYIRMNSRDTFNNLVEQYIHPEIRYKLQNN